MKLRLGGSLNLKIQLGQYEPCEVSSLVEIEDEVDEKNLDEVSKNMYNKIDAMLEADIKSKMSKAAKQYRAVKEMLRTI